MVSFKTLNLPVLTSSEQLDSESLMKRTVMVQRVKPVCPAVDTQYMKSLLHCVIELIILSKCL